MFNNLIESSSHAKEFKRRGSFLLLTTATYFVLLVLAGVGSIYAYDAHLDSQSTELEITFVPIVPEKPPAEQVKSIVRPAAGSTTNPSRSIRTELIDSTSNPNNVPVNVGTEASRVPPALPTSTLGSVNVDPEGPPVSTRGTPGGTGDTTRVELPDIPPPPTPNPPPAVPKIIKISRILNSEARSLPKPAYPTLAKQARVQGTVSVQITIDETGKVIAAKATGHPLLVAESQKAAMQARFSPTVVGETPVKVSGVITYNFVLP